MPEFIRYCVELLEPLGAVRVKRMFGGHGLYVDDLFIAIVSDEQLYLKADEQSLPAFDAAGSVPFCFNKQGETIQTHYRRAPEEAMESPVLMRPWARLALEAALRKRTAVKPAGKQSATTTKKKMTKKTAAKT